MSRLSAKKIKLDWGALCACSTHTTEHWLTLETENKASLPAIVTLDIMVVSRNIASGEMDGVLMKVKPFHIEDEQIRRRTIQICTTTLDNTYPHSDTEAFSKAFPYWLDVTFLEGEDIKGSPTHHYHFARRLAPAWRPQKGGKCYLPPLTMAAHARESISRFKALLGRLSFDLRVHG